MRDMTGQSALDKQEALKENEELKDEMAQLVKLCEKMKKDAEVAEQQAAELREQVCIQNLIGLFAHIAAWSQQKCRWP